MPALPSIHLPFLFLQAKHPNFPLGDSLFPSLTPQFQASIRDLRCTISLKTGITSGMDMCPCQFNRVYPKLLLELLRKRVSKQIGCKSRILLLSNLPRGQICLRVKPTQRGKKLRDRDRVLIYHMCIWTRTCLKPSTPGLFS